MRALTFLIVDDNELMRRIAQATLERAGHQVMFAASPDEVEAMLSAHDAQVVLVSAALPADGARGALAAALRVRREPVAAPPVVVVGAGDAQRTAGEQLLALGAAGLVPRPWERDRLAPLLELYAMGAAPATVLVVDDSPTQRHATVTVLGRAGHTLVEARDGVIALELLAERPDIDLVLTDVVMPRMDGYDLCQAIRARPRGRDLPVVMFTSLDDVASQSRAIDVGADDVLVKPISATELQARVRSILRLKTLQRKLARQNEELAQALKLRHDLTHLLVHDFRNPLSIVLVSADMIDEACQEAGLPRASELARDVVGAGLRLRGFCDDLLDVARIEGGATQPRMDVFPLIDVADRVATDLRRLSEHLGVKMRVQVPPRLAVRADKDWIYRVLQNLVDNALKYAPPQSAITVAAAIFGPMIEVQVADEGPGIPEEFRRKVFEKFAQLGGGGRRGSGLGLAFCRLAVEAHGGTIEARAAGEDQPGSVFAFTLPAA